MFSRTRRALVHGVEDLLAAALGADPDFTAAGLAQRLGHARAHQVGAQLDREGHAAAAGRERGGELVHPIGPETEDVVGEPDVVGPIVALADAASPRPLAAAGRCRYWFPQMGFAHQLQRNEQPRDAAMLRLK